MKHSKSQAWWHTCFRPWKQILCCLKPRQVMVKHTRTHTNNFPPAVEDCCILKAVTSAPAGIHIQWANLGSTGLSPPTLNHLRGTYCFLSGMFSPASSAVLFLLFAESHLTSVQQATFSLSPSLLLTDCFTFACVCACIFVFCANNAFESECSVQCSVPQHLKLCVRVFVFGYIHTLFCLCSLQLKVKACCYGNSNRCTTCREQGSCILHTIFYSTADWLGTLKHFTAYTVVSGLLLEVYVLIHMLCDQPHWWGIFVSNLILLWQRYSTQGPKECTKVICMHHWSVSISV